MAVIWHIRAATQKDSDQLKACMESAYVGYQQQLGGVRLPPMDADYSAEIENYPTWVVESEGNIIGGLTMVFERNYASIANIAIDPKFQGHGIGGGLMKFAEAKARAAKLTELQLATHVLLVDNIALYQHLGWQETARDETRVFMKKVL